jgi:hypothetical protein
VVTEFEFELHQVGTAALLVDLFYRPEQAPAALRRWRELLADAPREATLTAWVGTAGPWSFLAPALWDRPLAAVGCVWVGDPDQGRKLLAALGDGPPPPVAERVQELTYLELQTMDDEVHRHGLLRRYWKGHYLRDLGDGAIQAFLSRGADGEDDPGRLPAGSLQSYGGAALWRGGRAVRQRRVRQRPHRRGPGRHPARLRPRHAGTAGRPEGSVRSRQRLPPQPQHPPPQTMT